MPCDAGRRDDESQTGPSGEIPVGVEGVGNGEGKNGRAGGVEGFVNTEEDCFSPRQ